VLAALVIVAAGVLVYALSGGPWAQAELAGADGAGSGAQVELRLSGDVDVEPGNGPVADQLDSSTAAGAALEGSVASATRDLTQTLALLIAVVAAVGLIVDLPPRLWSLLAAAALVCLLAAAILRDSTTSALSQSAGALDAGGFQVDPTGWASLAIGAAAAAALAAFLATAERGSFSAVPIVPDGEVGDGNDGGNGGDGRIDGQGDSGSSSDLAKRRGRLGGPGRNRPLNWLPSRER
jgi:hypothetical protein